MALNDQTKDFSHITRWRRRSISQIIILVLVLLQVAVSSLDEGECLAETDLMGDGQCSSTTSRRTIVDVDSGVDENMQDTAKLVGDEYADDNHDDGNGDNYVNFGDDGDYSNCKDDHKDCEMWASVEECDKNPAYMLINCKKSCKFCDDSTPVTKYGDIQICEGDEASACLSVVAKMEGYMISESKTNPAFREIQSKCINRHTHCAFWAAKGECEATPEYMEMQCAPVCGSCMLVDFDNKRPLNEVKDAFDNGCSLDPEVEETLAPGDLLEPELGYFANLVLKVKSLASL